MGQFRGEILITERQVQLSFHPLGLAHRPYRETTIGGGLFESGVVPRLAISVNGADHPEGLPFVRVVQAIRANSVGEVKDVSFYNEESQAPKVSDLYANYEMQMLVLM